LGLEFNINIIRVRVRFVEGLGITALEVIILFGDHGTFGDHDQVAISDSVLGQI